MGVHPIKEAERIGRLSNGPTGGLALRAIEISYILRCTRQSTFAGDIPMRLRQGVLLIAPAGIGKSYVTDFFFGKMCGAYNIMRPDSNLKWNGKSPRVIDDDGETTWEAWRGGCTTSGEPIRPLALDGDFVVLTELTTIIGEGSKLDVTRARKVGILAEEGRMTVKQLKFNEMDEESFSKFVEAAKAYDKPEQGRRFYVSTDPRGYSFQTPVSFVMCTTPPSSQEDVKKLNACGFYSRFDLVDGDTTFDEELELIGNFGRHKSPDVGNMRKVNEDMWHTKFCPIPYPPDALMLDYAQKWLQDQTREISTASNVRPISVSNLRTVGTLARLMAAHAIARIFESRQPGDRNPVESISYSKADADFAISYLTRHMDRLRLTTLDDEKSKMFDDIPDVAHSMMKATLAHEWNYNDGTPLCGKAEDFISFHKQYGVSEGTARNYLTRFRKAGIITGGKYGEKLFHVSNRPYVENKLKLVAVDMLPPPEDMEEKAVLN
jgi:hypothetical protein